MTTFKNFYEKDTLLEAKKPKEEGTFCYMLYPDKKSEDAIKEIVKSLSSDVDGTKVGDYHCTIRYFAATNNKKKGADGLIEYLDAYSNLPIIDAYPKNFAIFGPSNDYLVFELTSLRLHDWYNRVNFEMVMKGYPDSDYPVFKPHTSLFKKADLVKGAPKFDIEKYRIPITFDRHVITNEKEKVIWEKEGTRLTK